MDRIIKSVDMIVEVDNEDTSGSLFGRKYGLLASSVVGGMTTGDELRGMSLFGLFEASGERPT